MPTMLMMLVLGAAAGFIATRAMKITLDVPTTVLLGMAGAGIAWLGLRMLAWFSGTILLVIGAVAGAAVLIWAWQRFSR